MEIRGDVNLEHGKYFIFDEKDFEGEYRVVYTSVDDDTGDIYVRECLVDVNDSWINRDGVEDTCDCSLEDDVYDYVVSLLMYYGGHEFGGEPAELVSQDLDEVEIFVEDLLDRLVNYYG